MPIQVPPSPPASQVPEYARRYEDLKSRFHSGGSVDGLKPGRRHKVRKSADASICDACRPAPAAKASRVRLPRRREVATAVSESKGEKNWKLRSAGIAVVASLVVSVLVNIVMTGLDAGVGQGAFHLGNLLAGMRWGL